MPTTLVFAIIAMTLALTFYTVGVMWERREGRLRARHFVFFVLGLACDSSGTLAMSGLSPATASAGPSLHVVTGALALALMFLHAVWAAVVLIRRNETMERQFHKLSIAVWTFWLVPYLCGILIGVPAFALDGAAALAIAAVATALIGTVAARTVRP